ncbi:Nucleoside 2-deoxyribosyltransferase [compost metagenome]
MTTRPRVYLAGPDVFRPDAAQHFAALKAICDTLGLEALSPFDVSVTPETSPHAIYSNNMALLRSAQGVVANLAPFRGAEPDSGTAFEVGVAAALGVPVVGYGAADVGANLVTAALLVDNAQEALQALAGLLKA